MKVLAFDSWTEGGTVHLQKLVNAFASRSVELSLLHIGSWGHDTGRAKEESIGPLPVRDVSYYGGLSFRRILERERPDVVLFLSTQAFAHRAFNRYCRQLGIPTMHLYHGLVSVQQTSARRLNPVNLRRQIAMGLERLPKNATRLWPVYARALWDTDSSAQEWRWFVYDIWRKAAGNSYSGQAALDARTDACCVFTEADVQHAVSRYRIPRERVFVVGNPDLSRWGIGASDLGSAAKRDRRHTNDVVYIDTALLAAGAVFDNELDFVRHVTDTAEVLAAKGLRLVVKLHPAHDQTQVPELLARQKVPLCDTGNFLKTLREARGAIVEPSSAALIPALLGLPLLLASYGRLAAQEYGDVLAQYPRARTLRSIDSVATAIDGLDSDDPRLDAWISANAGPMPAEDMPYRVAEACRTLAAIA